MDISSPATTRTTTMFAPCLPPASVVHVAPKEAISPPPALHLIDTCTEVNDLSPCSSAASTIALGHHPASTVVPLLAEPIDKAEVTYLDAAAVQRAVTYLVGLMAPTTNLKAVRSTHTALLHMLSTLLEKGFTSWEQVLCAMALATRLNPAASAGLEDHIAFFPSMEDKQSNGFQLLPSTTRRALLGLLRLVAKVHSDVYYSAKDMLAAVDLSVTEDMVGMTTRCEWRLFDALGGNMSVSLDEYALMQRLVEAK